MKAPNQTYTIKASIHDSFMPRKVWLTTTKLRTCPQPLPLALADPGRICARPHLSLDAAVVVAPLLAVALLQDCRVGSSGLGPLLKTSGYGQRAVACSQTSKALGPEPRVSLLAENNARKPLSP